MANESYQYLVDASGTRTHVVLPLHEYEALLAQLDGAKTSTATATSPALIASPPTSDKVAADKNLNVANLAPSATEEVFTFYLPRKRVVARGRWQRSGKMVVLKGSTIARKPVSAMKEDYRNLRQKLIALGIIEEVNGALTFTRDYSFDNPSIAACVIEGGSRSGYESWKDSKERTIRQLGFSR